MRIALHSVSYAGVWPGQVTLPIERVIDKARELNADLDRSNKKFEDFEKYRDLVGFVHTKPMNFN